MISFNVKQLSAAAAVASKSRRRKRLYSSCLVAVVVLLLLGTVAMFKTFHKKHPQQQLPPILTLSYLNATPLSYANNTATWMLGISLSNPNPNYHIYFKDFTVGLAYNNHSAGGEFGPNVFTLGVDLLDDFVQPPKSIKNLSSNISFSTRDFSLGNVDLVERLLEDQKAGSVMVSVSVNFSIKFTEKSDSNWTKMISLCDHVHVRFFKKPIGVASILPKGFQLSTV